MASNSGSGGALSLTQPSSTPGRSGRVAGVVPSTLTSAVFSRRVPDVLCRRRSGRMDRQPYHLRQVVGREQVGTAAEHLASSARVLPGHESSFPQVAALAEEVPAGGAGVTRCHQAVLQWQSVGRGRSGVVDIGEQPTGAVDAREANAGGVGETPAGHGAHGQGRRRRRRLDGCSERVGAA